MHQFLIQLRKHINRVITPTKIPEMGTKSLGSVGEDRIEGTHWSYNGIIKSKTAAGIQQRIRNIQAVIRKHGKALEKSGFHVNILHNMQTGQVIIRVQGPADYFLKEKPRLDVTWHNGKHFSEAPAWKDHINKRTEQ